MPTPLTWVTTPALGQGRSSGGSAAAELFEGGASQRRRSLLETLVREICQNSTDQRVGSKAAEVYFDLILLRGEEREAFLGAINWQTLRPHLSAVKGAGGAALTLRAGIEAMEAETLICLRISDSGTAGLTGDDWDEEGNFRRLCIQNFSTGEETGRGGSFGLGKAVKHPSNIQLRESVLPPDRRHVAGAGGAGQIGIIHDPSCPRSALRWAPLS
jgi:hypothetical protein